MAGFWNGTTYFGDETDETVTGTNAAEVIGTWLGKDVIDAGGGNDTVDSGLDSDTIYGGDGDDVLYDLNSIDSSFTGLIGKDRIFGGAGNDTVWFNSVDSPDAAVGGSGRDTLVVRFNFLGAHTSLAVEYALGDGSIVYVTGEKGLRTTGFEQLVFYASDGDDIIAGGALNDSLYGGNGTDYLNGLGGDDWIDVGTGSFTAYGGKGRDTLVIDLSPIAMAQKLHMSSNFTLSMPDITGTATGFEVFSVKTGSGDDRVIGAALNDSLDGGTGGDALYGANGDDLLTLGLGHGRAYGGDGNDHITYSNGFFDPTPDAGDRAEGGAGNDWIQFALGGNNTGYGGDGDDNLSVRYDGSTYGTTNLLDGGDGNDSVNGGNGADHLFGGAGNDVIGSFTRVQEVRGGKGDDTVTLNGSTTDPVAAGQVLDGGLGTDRLNWTGELSGTVDLTGVSYTTVHGSTWTGFESYGLYVGLLGDTVLTFGAGNDKLQAGGAVHLTANGGRGDDILIANPTTRADLFGGFGDDHLTAARGTGSYLEGGTGNDVLGTQFTTGNSTLDGGTGFDVATFAYQVTANLTLGTAVRSDGITETLIGIEGVSGTYGDDVLIGNAGDNQFFNGGRGTDLITTGGGADTVLVYTFGLNSTHLTDFNHAQDGLGLIGLNQGAAALPNGMLDADRLVFGSFATAPTATMAGPEFFYDRSSGYLWEDADGTGSAAATLIFVLDNRPLLDATDFIIGDYLYR